MPNGFGYLDFSRGLVIAGAAFGLLTIFAVLIGNSLKDRRWVLVARRSMTTAGLLTIGAAGGLIAGFVDGRYERSYIYNYSEKGLPLHYKIAGLWGGLDGSILFWAALIGFVGILVAAGFRKDEKDRTGRRMEPWVYLTLGGVQLFFLVVVAFVTNPFEHLIDSPMFASLPEGVTKAQAFAHHFPAGITDGTGLNPLLVNYWMMIHPPTLYFGWVVYTVPFAFAIAALITGEQGNYWITKIRRWTMVGWLFNTTGIILGGLWAYVVLGWGGYWAWDPVENASFLPWFTSTALLDSMLVQERRGMMRAWNAFLATATFALSIFGTYLTRSGIVSSVHAFAGGEVGHWFLGFLLFTIALCLFLISIRQPTMRSAHVIESVWSREAMFVINNLVLLAIAASIMILTLWPKISHEFLGKAVTVGPPVYNMVTLPFFILLLGITAIGPALGWIRTSPKALRRNILIPMIAALPVAVVVQYGAEMIRAGETGHLTWSQRLYPTFAVIYASVLIIFTVLYEVLRTAQSRALRTGNGWLEALSTLFLVNNRRYGGYVVHAGIGVIAIGIVCSSMYRVEHNTVLGEGDQIKVGRYDLTLSKVEENMDGDVYHDQKLYFDVDPEVGSAFQMIPEKRFYIKKEQPSSVVEIHRGLTEDLYVYFQSAQEGKFSVTIYRNPMIIGVWLGWILMILGGVYAALPLGRKRVGLAD